MLIAIRSEFCFFFLIILIVCHFYDVLSIWPSMDSSNINLLGLFPDDDNISDLDVTTLSVHSRAMFIAAIILAQQYNMTINGDSIGWKAKHTGGNTMTGLRDTCEVVSNTTIAGIIGPGFSREAITIAQFSNTIGIPTISYSATDPDLSDRNAYPSFYRTIPSDNSAAIVILNLFIRFNWTSCIIIHQNDAYGLGGAKVINKVFNDYGLGVETLIVFDIVTLKIQGNLRKSLIKSASRIVIVWALSSHISDILQYALEVDVVGPHFTWILSANISFNAFNRDDYEKLIGMFFIRPVTGSTIVNASINSSLLNAAFNIWQQYEPETFPGTADVDAYALFAFDATWVLIQSLQKLCSLSLTESSLCFDRRFSHSNILLDLINNTTFIGVSGPIEFSSNSTDRNNGIYYSIYNSHLLENHLKFFPVLDYSTDIGLQICRENNTIIWPDGSLTVASDRPKLYGVTLRIGIIETAPFTMIANTTSDNEQNITRYIGFIPDLIALLQEQLGFVADMRLAPRNMTYNQLIHTVPQDIYDLFIADTTIMATRRVYVEFSNSIFDNSLKLVARKSSTTSVDMLSFLRPFSWSLWLLVLGVFLFASFLIFLAERHHNENLKHRSILSQVIMSTWYAYGNLVGYGVDFNVQTAGGRLITAGLYMCSLIFVASYTANLASILTVSKMQETISGIDDLKSGKVPPNRIGIRVGTASEEFYLREISRGLRNYIPLQTRKDTYDYLVNKAIDVAIVDSATGEYMINTYYCNLTFVGQSFDENAFGIVMAKDWIYAQQLDVSILSLRESGALSNLREKWLLTSYCIDDPDTTEATSIQSISGLLVTFAVIMFLSIGLICWTKRQMLKHRFMSQVSRQTAFQQQESVMTSIDISSKQELKLSAISQSII